MALIAIVSGGQGCLYLQNGKSQDVRFESSPPGAQVTVNGIQYGATPTQVTLSRCESYTVVVDKAGYKSGTVLLSRSVSGMDSLMMFVDSLLILPGLVDGFNCSQASLAPSPVVVQLNSDSGIAAPDRAPNAPALPMIQQR
jgi:hypothetical protein